MESANTTKPLPELGSDSYKDVLASLSELDTTNAINIDYLEANKTRTFRFSTDTILQDSPQKSTVSSKFSTERLKKLFFALLLFVILFFLIIMTSKL